jgi:hypothetical protein
MNELCYPLKPFPSFRRLSRNLKFAQFVNLRFLICYLMEVVRYRDSDSVIIISTDSDACSNGMKLEGSSCIDPKCYSTQDHLSELCIAPFEYA